MFDWYPDPEGGWHLGAALGLGDERLEIGGFDDSRLDVAVSAIGGYDWRLSGRWSLGVTLDASLYSAVPLNDQYGAPSTYHPGSEIVTLDFTGVLH